MHYFQVRAVLPRNSNAEAGKFMTTWSTCSHGFTEGSEPLNLLLAPRFVLRESGVSVV